MAKSQTEQLIIIDLIQLLNIKKTNFFKVIKISLMNLNKNHHVEDKR